MPQHPCLLLTKANIEPLRQGCHTLPLLKKSFAKQKKLADQAIELFSPDTTVPTPKDAGGGITHEQHKQNYLHIAACGVAFQITQEPKYADYIQMILLLYAKNYRSWPLHPKRKEKHPVGKLFWQNLNDCVWLVHVIQGYDAAYHHLAPETRAIIENDLFHPIIELLTVIEANTFNRIHNHGTWSCAAVGLTGYVLGNQTWVDMALSGFKRQLEALFSPDGYYSEGPYYQRYALLPFMTFATAIAHHQPELEIFKFRDRVLTKTVHTVLQTTYNSEFFLINDAIEKSYRCSEMITAACTVYHQTNASDLLSIINEQNEVLVSDAGLAAATAIAANQATPFLFETMLIRDGHRGDEGGLAILRDQQLCVVLKACAQGGGHGHFDRLNVLHYDNGNDIRFAYGVVRFLNIETKGGGNYLTENDTFAKQTIAHNTLTVDQRSHFKGELKLAAKSHADIRYFDANQPIVSAEERHAYPGVILTRTVAYIKVKGLNPIIVDVFKASSEQTHQYDLPFWYKGIITDYGQKPIGDCTIQKPLGDTDGYQHLWHIKTTSFTHEQASHLTVLKNNRFYTTHFTTDPHTSVVFAATGANDPDGNLTKGQAFILRHQSAKHTFVSLTEGHGKRNLENETAHAAKSAITNLNLVTANDQQTQFEFTAKGKRHSVTLNYATHTSGFFAHHISTAPTHSAIASPLPPMPSAPLPV